MGDGVGFGYLPGANRAARHNRDDRVPHNRPGRGVLQTVGNLLTHRASGGQQYLLRGAVGQEPVQLLLHFAYESRVGLDVDGRLGYAGRFVDAHRYLRRVEVGGGVAEHYPARSEHPIAVCSAFSDAGKGDAVGLDTAAVFHCDVQQALRRVDEPPGGEDPEALAGVFHDEGRGAFAATDPVTV